MDKKKLEEIVDYIVKQGLQALEDNTDEKAAVLDYVAVFSKDENEYREMEQTAEFLGDEIDKESAKTGRTFSLNEPITTSAEFLKLLKIRRPDSTRPQRGAPDFKVSDYEKFKDKYLKNSRNLTLMIRSEYEMIEIKGANVLVYIPSKSLGDRLKAGADRKDRAGRR